MPDVLCLRGIFVGIVGNLPIFSSVQNYGRKKSSNQVQDRSRESTSVYLRDSRYRMFSAGLLGLIRMLLRAAGTFTANIAVSM